MLNPDKTELLFLPGQASGNHNLSINIDNSAVPANHMARSLLGVTPADRLSFATAIHAHRHREDMSVPEPDGYPGFWPGLFSSPCVWTSATPFWLVCLHGPLLLCSSFRIQQALLVLNLPECSHTPSLLPPPAPVTDGCLNPIRITYTCLPCKWLQHHPTSRTWSNRPLRSEGALTLG